MEELLADCCIKFLELIENLKMNGKITREEFCILSKPKIEFLSHHGYSDNIKNTPKDSPGGL